jgi:hypothetical protein
MTAEIALRFLQQDAPNRVDVVAEAGTRTVLRAHFHCRTGQALLPTADALFCLGIYPACEVGAPLHINGDVDPVLLGRTDVISRLYKSWWPACRIVPVTAAKALPRAVPDGRVAALFFSSGVDSSYSLLEALPRLSAIITLLGVDVPLSDKTATARLEASCHEAARSKGLEPIVIETNVSQAFHPFAGWIEHHGSALSAIGHMLSDRVDHLSIATSGNYLASYLPWGSHPALDPLFSSSRLTIEQHGHVPRFDKIGRIAGDKALLNQLRICNRSSANCGVCGKCTFAMRCLEVLGIDSVPTFPAFSPRRGQLNVYDDVVRGEMERLRDAALQAGRGEIAEEAGRSIVAYSRIAGSRGHTDGRFKSWSRVMRHRWRWRRASR